MIVDSRLESPNWKNRFKIVGRSRNHVDADELPDATCCGGPGLSRRLHRPDVTPDDRRNKAGIHLLPSHENHVGSLHHGVSRLDHTHETPGFDQPESIANLALVPISHDLPPSSDADLVYAISRLQALSDRDQDSAALVG